jgi:phosphoglycolate phosphatase-like HAD superfamily hydrolase
MAIDPARVQAICFDIDGTLADTDDVYVIRLASRLRPLRHWLGRRDLKALSRRAVMALEGPANFLVWLVDSLGLDEPASRIMDALYQLRGAPPAPRTRMISGVREALIGLSAHYSLAIVSARDRRSTHAFLNQHGLRSYFQAVASARTCRRAKPHPAPVLWAARALGVDPRACLMVGDTTHDILAGKAAGAQAVGVLCGFGERTELEKAGADWILNSTAELPQVFQVPAGTG